MKLGMGGASRTRGSARRPDRLGFASIFVSFGLFARPNTTVMVALFVCALSLSSAIFLILELDRPFEGLIQISSAPMREALACESDSGVRVVRLGDWPDGEAVAEPERVNSGGSGPLRLDLSELRSADGRGEGQLPEASRR